MKHSLLGCSALLVCLATPAISAPRIDALQNNYSYLLPDNPSYGIARGSIFIIYGEDLSNSTTGLQSSTEPPFLQTTLNGVSAQVTVNGVTTNVIWYYLTPSQLGGILPSTTPAGNGVIVVNNNGEVSAPAPIVVVDSAFGVLSLNGSGTGAAAVYDANFQFLSAANSAKPGDGIMLFGTGLGPTAGSETMQVPPVDMPEIPIAVEIAGTPATVLFRGRIFPGLDQVNVLIPDLVPTPLTARGALTEFGCNLPVTIKIGDYQSNVTTIPLSQDGGDCPPPPDPGGGGSGSTNDLSISEAEKNQWISAGQYRIGGLGLTRQASYTITDDFATGASTTMVQKSDVLSASFSRITGPDLAKLFNSSQLGIFSPAAGQCAVTIGIPANPLPNLVYTSLDAGPSVSTTGPNGTRTAPRVTQGVPNNYSYGETIGAGVSGDFLDPGTYRLEGSGGPDVGAFAGNLRIAPDLEWTNRINLTVIDRNQPLTVTWVGGEPTTLVSVQGTSTVTDNGAVSVATFTCWANNPDGQLTVPAAILQQMPASGRISAGNLSILMRGTLAVASVGTGVRMFTSGVDYLTGGNQWGIAQSAEYK